MREVPKIVYERLRSGAPKEMHPDPDLLTAFAEQALLPAEREDVLQHLALCEDCRAVVVLALPPAESVAVAQVAPESPAAAGVSGTWKRRWLGRPVLVWPTLRWASLAAGVIVAGAILLQHSDNLNRFVVSKQTALVSKSEPAGTAANPSAPLAPNATGANAEKDTTLADRKAAEIAKNLAPNLLVQKKALLKAKQAEGRSVVPENKLLASTSLAARDKLATVGAAIPASRAPAVPSTSQTVEVTGAAAEVVQTEDATIAAKQDNQLTARNDLLLNARNAAALPVTRAKPPTAAEQAAPTQYSAKTASNARSAGVGARVGASQSPPQWSLSAGSLRRSLDGGVSWQTALPDSHLLCYAAGPNDVWTAGRSGVVYHSADNGATWVQVHPSIGDRPLSDDVTRIELRGTTEIDLFISNGETWTTADNGKTWTKK